MLTAAFDRAVPPASPTVRVLVVDGDRHVRIRLRALLEGEGYDVVEAADGAEALDRLDDAVDLVLLELALPGMSGFSLCRAVRDRSDVPMVVVAAQREEVDKVLALEIGADDYITKPFLDREVALRARAVLRRARRCDAPKPPSGEVPAPLRLVPQLQSVAVGERQVALSSREFRLLDLLLRHEGRLLSREQILSSVWGEQCRSDSKTLDAQVRRLRGKIEDDPHHPTLLLTVRGVGYRLAM